MLSVILKSPRMTLDELTQRLIVEGVDPLAYHLAGGHPPECYTLRAPFSLHPEQHESVALDAGSRAAWSVYYSEKDLETGLRTFAGVSEACNYLFGLLLSDASVKARKPRT
jgi:hypothetical protein